ncbi:MAG: carbonic anhydrase [Hyphomicrobiaceae bacterium]
MTIPIELAAGYRRFRQERFAIEAERYRALGAGQRPQTMIIGCADSRVDPATIFTAAPGELFVARNVAALVPPCEESGSYHGTSAAIEFAIEALEVRNIVVMGHGMCGGIAAALAAAQHRPVGRFIAPWVDLVSAVRDELLQRANSGDAAARQKALEHLAVQHSLRNLTTFPFVCSAIGAGRLALHGAWFSIRDGELWWLNADTGAFEQVPA